MQALRILLAAICLIASASSAPLASAADTAQAPGNRLLFTDEARELVLGPEVQQILALAALGLVIVIGLAQLRSKVMAGSGALIFLGATLFYSAWVFHKWTITGHFIVLYGHLISLAVAGAGVSLAALGMYSLIKSPGNASQFCRRWLFPYAVFLVFALATGTATIFEAVPTIFGSDPPLLQLAVFVLLGSAASAAGILSFIRALCRMA